MIYDSGALNAIPPYLINDLIPAPLFIQLFKVLPSNDHFGGIILGDVFGHGKGKRIRQYTIDFFLWNGSGIFL